MTLNIIQEETKKRDTAHCPDCEIRINKIWISHDYRWVPIGVLCKKCGYIEVWGLADSLTKGDNDG